MLRLSPRTCAALALAAATGADAAAGCTPTTPTTTVVTPTSVALDPSEVMGTVPCSADPGAAKAYVVTLHDLTDPTQDAKFTLPAFTPPAVSCVLPVVFQNVVELHHYAADVAVYDVPPSEVTFGITKPAWATSCATSGVGAATVTNEARTFIHGCVPLDAPGTHATSVVVDTAALALPLGCTSATGGKIASFRVTPMSPSGALLPSVVADCGQATITFDQGVQPSTAYTFVVKAFAASGGAAEWATRCTAVTKPGVEIAASCPPLSNQGSASIDPSALLTAAGLTCGGAGATAAASYDVTFDAGAPSQLSAAGVPCSAAAVVGPLAAGDHGADVVVRNAAGARIGHAICFGAIAPGDVTTVPCTPN